MAAPVAAQTTVGAPGLVGQSACGNGYTYNVVGNHLAVNANVINGAGNQSIFTNNFFGVTYTFLRNRVDGDSPATSFPLKLRLLNSKTGAQASETDLGTVTATNAVDRANNQFSVSAKTPYTAIYYADVAGLGAANPINTLCFMTGGTYTIENAGSSNFINRVWKLFGDDRDVPQTCGPNGNGDCCTVAGQLGTDSEIRARATAKLNSIFGSESNYMQITSTSTCDDKCDERFPRSDSASMRAKNACYDQCRAAASSTPSWATLVANEIAAIERTFDPGKCRAPEVDQPQTNGCYSISPRTPFDINNCLCGRSPQPAGADCDSS